MRLVRLILRVALLICLPVSMGVLLFSVLASRGELEKARSLYEETAGALERSTGVMKDREDRLLMLTTSVEAVEREARNQFRLIRPGETLILVEGSGTR